MKLFENHSQAAVIIKRERLLSCPRRAIMIKTMLGTALCCGLWKQRNKSAYDMGTVGFVVIGQ